MRELKQMNTLELDTMMYCFMVSEEWKIWTFISFEEELIPGFQSGFHCVILDLKDLLSHLFPRIVTFNN